MEKDNRYSRYAVTRKWSRVPLGYFNNFQDACYIAKKLRVETKEQFEFDVLLLNNENMTCKRIRRF